MAYSGGGLPSAPPEWHDELTPEQHATLLLPGTSGRAASVEALKAVKKQQVGSKL